MDVQRTPAGKATDLMALRAKPEHHRGRTRHVATPINPAHMDPRATRLRKADGRVDRIGAAEQERARKNGNRAEAHLRSLIGYHPLHGHDQPAWALAALDHYGVERQD